MSRIKIQISENFIFETVIEIQIGDINYGDHLGNDAVLRLAHEARMRFLAHNDYTEKDIEGQGLIMTDAAIQYKSEGRYGDRLKIKLAVDDITSVGFDLIYVITNIVSGKEVAIVKTGMAFFNYDSRSIGTTPEIFLKKFSS